MPEFDHSFARQAVQPAAQYLYYQPKLKQNSKIAFLEQAF